MPSAQELLRHHLGMIGKAKKCCIKNRLLQVSHTTNVKLRLRFDVYLTFHLHLPEPHLTT